MNVNQLWVSHNTCSTGYPESVHYNEDRTPEGVNSSMVDGVVHRLRQRATDTFHCGNTGEQSTCKNMANISAYHFVNAGNELFSCYIIILGVMCTLHLLVKIAYVVSIRTGTPRRLKSFSLS